MSIKCACLPRPRPATRLVPPASTSDLLIEVEQAISRITSDTEDGNSVASKLSGTGSSVGRSHRDESQMGSWCTIRVCIDSYCICLSRLSFLQSDLQEPVKGAAPERQRVKDEPKSFVKGLNYSQAACRLNYSRISKIPERVDCSLRIQSGRCHERARAYGRVAILEMLSGCLGGGSRCGNPAASRAVSVAIRDAVVLYLHICQHCCNQPRALLSSWFCHRCFRTYRHCLDGQGLQSSEVIVILLLLDSLGH